jgi:hypothetical protein
VAFGQSRRRWFGACSCKPTSRGRPSSVKQLRTSSAFRLFAVLLANYCRYTGQVNSNRSGGISNLRFRGYTTTENSRARDRSHWEPITLGAGARSICGGFFWALVGYADNSPLNITRRYGGTACVVSIINRTSLFGSGSVLFRACWRSDRSSTSLSGPASPNRYQVSQRTWSSGRG